MPPSSHSSKLTQTQQLRQRLLPQQVLLARMLELSDREMEEEVQHQLEENPALERIDDPLSAPRYYTPRQQPDLDSTDPGSLAVARAATLPELLCAQLAEQNLPDKVRRLAEFMTGSLDSNGYFTRTLPQLAADAALTSDGTLDPTLDETREAWAAIRTLDPPGVGAMDLRDCLLLQLNRLPDSTPHIESAREVVRHYFDLFSHRNFNKLSEESGLSPDELRRANALIVTLNPKPAASISAEADTAPSDGVTPDFIVETDGERVSVSMPNSLPELVLEQSFNIADDAPHTEGNEFIRANARQARDFIEMLSRRRNTLMAIASAIVNHQRDFFISGDDESRIRPMVLRDIASATGLDMSTISRATAGKWFATPFGVYSAKSFFNEQVGDDTSARELSAAIRAIIDSEEPSHPIGDDAITAKLASQGINVARRTVAKYRDRMGIPPARLRRQA